MKKILNLFVMLCISFAVTAQKKPLTIDDMMKMGRLSSFCVSPNGEFVVYAVGNVNFEVNKVVSDLYLLNLKTNETKRLTEGKGAANPSVSKDNETVFFTKGGQVVKLNFKTNTEETLTNFSAGVNGFVLSPDETKIAFDSDVYPDCDSDDCNKQKAEAVEKSKVKAQLYDKLPFRVWNYWKNGMRTHVWIYDLVSKSYKDVTPGDYDTPPIDLGGEKDYRFSTDGKTIYFTRNPDKNVAWSTNNDVFSVSVLGGEVKNLTTENKGNDNNAYSSPSGKMIAYNSMKRAGFEADKIDLIILDEKGNKKNLTENIDLSVGQTEWTSDSKNIFFTASTKGYDPLYSISVSDGKMELILDKVYINHFEILPNQKSVLFSASKSSQPAEIFLLELKTKKVTQLTNINSSLLSTIEMNEPQEIWFDGANARKIHGFVYTPPGFDKTKKYPMIFWVHGGPQGAWGNTWSTRWNPQVWAANGWIVVAPNPTGSTGYGQKLTDDISLDWNGKVFTDLMNGLDYSIKQFPQIDESRMAAAGASYGGYMMNWFQGHTTRFKTLICHDGVYNVPSMFGATEEVWFPLWEYGGTPWTNPEHYKSISPDQYVKNFKTPTLIIHGALDFRIPDTQAIEYFTTLQYLGIESKLLHFPDEGHWVLKPQNSKLWHETIFGWLKEKLK